MEDRVLTGFLQASAASAVARARLVIEHLSRNEWLDDCIAGMLRVRLRRDRQDPQQTRYWCAAEPVPQNRRRFLMIDHIGFPVFQL